MIDDESLQFGGYESQDAADLVGALECLRAVEGVAGEQIDAMTARGDKGVLRRHKFLAKAKRRYGAYAREEQREGRPVLSLWEWIKAHPQIVLQIIGIVLMLVL